METKARNANEVFRFAHEFGHRPERELEYLAAVFWNPEADWATIKKFIPEVITPLAFLEAYSKQTNEFNYSTPDLSYREDATRNLFLPQFQALSLLVDGPNELLEAYVAMVLEGKEYPILISHCFDGIEAILKADLKPIAWEAENGFHRGTFGSLNSHNVNPDVRLSLIRCIALFHDYTRSLSKGHAYGLARIAVEKQVIDQEDVERYWRWLEDFYRMPPHRQEAEEAARIARLDGGLNALCAALIGAYGPATILNQYLEAGNSLASTP